MDVVCNNADANLHVAGGCTNRITGCRHVINQLVALYGQSAINLLQGLCTSRSHGLCVLLMPRFSDPCSDAVGASSFQKEKKRPVDVCRYLFVITFWFGNHHYIYIAKIFEHVFWQLRLPGCGGQRLIFSLRNILIYPELYYESQV